MSLFDWLLIGHLAGDFLLQTDEMAVNKGLYWQWMLRHVVWYAIAVGAVLIVYAWVHHLSSWLTGAALLFVVVTHVVLDRRGVVRWWIRLGNSSPDHSWLPIVVDQVFHLLILGVVAQVLAWASG